MKSPERLGPTFDVMRDLLLQQQQATIEAGHVDAPQTLPAIHRYMESDFSPSELEILRKIEQDSE